MSSSSFNLYVILSISFTVFILLFNKVNPTELTSFTITEFGHDQKNLIFQGDAITTLTGKLQLTKAVKNSIGRVLYSAPIHIWDSKTGDVANFETTFTFAITAPYSSNVADGLAFFIAPVDTQPQNIGRAGFLGVFNSENYNKSIQTVAVEIDTFHNTWDPKINRHIGINVNCIKSISTSSWVLENGREANVVIRFDALTNVLSVVLSYPGLPGSYILRDVVPLKDIVPEWVRIGFSAATGAEFAEHDIRYWSFHSELSLVFNNNNANVSSSAQAA